MKKSFYKLLVIFSMGSSLFSLEPDDKKGIQEIIESITYSWNDHAGHGFADYYADNAKGVFSNYDWPYSRLFSPYKLAPRA